MPFLTFFLNKRKISLWKWLAQEEGLLVKKNNASKKKQFPKKYTTKLLIYLHKRSGFT